MGQVVYSTELFSHHDFTSWSETFTVPAGFKFVIREWSGSITGSGIPGANLLAFRVSDSLSIISKQWPVLWQGSFRLPRLTVINPLDSVTVTVTGAGSPQDFSLVVSGWELKLP